MALFQTFRAINARCVGIYTVQNDNNNMCVIHRYNNDHELRGDAGENASRGHRVLQGAVSFCIIFDTKGGPVGGTSMSTLSSFFLQPTRLANDVSSGDLASVTDSVRAGVNRSLTLDIDETLISTSVGESMRVVKTVSAMPLLPKNVEVMWFLNRPARLVNARNLRRRVVISTLVPASNGDRSRSSPFLTRR